LATYERIAINVGVYIYSMLRNEKHTSVAQLAGDMAI